MHVWLYVQRKGSSGELLSDGFRGDFLCAEMRVLGFIAQTITRSEDQKG